MVFNNKVACLATRRLPALEAQVAVRRNKRGADADEHTKPYLSEDNPPKTVAEILTGVADVKQAEAVRVERVR